MISISVLPELMNFTARKAIEDMEREIRLSTFPAGCKQTFSRKQGKAAAIEAYQAGTGSDLAEALAYVEEIERAKLMSFLMIVFAAGIALAYYCFSLFLQGEVNNLFKYRKTKRTSHSIG